jgi:hypothetical protein
MGDRHPRQRGADILHGQVPQRDPPDHREHRAERIPVDLHARLWTTGTDDERFLALNKDEAGRSAYWSTMDRDPLADLPADTRREVIAEVRAVLDVESVTAEDLVRSAEPLWDAMERVGGLVDSWGGGEFSYIFPRVLAFIRSGAVSG